jgi:hypothetical protein
VRLHRPPRPAGEDPTNASPVAQAQRAKQQSKQRGDDERARDKDRDAFLRITVVVHELGTEKEERQTQHCEPQSPQPVLPRRTPSSGVIPGSHAQGPLRHTAPPQTARNRTRSGLPGPFAQHIEPVTVGARPMRAHRLLVRTFRKRNGHHDSGGPAGTGRRAPARQTQRIPQPRPMSLSRTGTSSDTPRVTQSRCSQSILTGTQRVRRRTTNCHPRPPRTNVGYPRNRRLQRLPISANHRRGVRALLRLLSRLSPEAPNFPLY